MAGPSARRYGRRDTCNPIRGEPTVWSLPFFVGAPVDSRRLQDTIRPLVEPLVQHLGFDVVAVEWFSGRRRPVLRISIDRPPEDYQGGVGADDCASVSHRLSPLLDAEDPIPGAYDLEISSPGMDRPVQRVDDFLRFHGYTARIRLEEGLPRRRYTGELRGLVDDMLLVAIGSTVHELPFESVEACHLVLDLDAYQALAEGLPPVPEPTPSTPEAAADPAVAPGAHAPDAVQEDAG